MLIASGAANSLKPEPSKGNITLRSITTAFPPIRLPTHSRHAGLRFRRQRASLALRTLAKRTTPRRSVAAIATREWRTIHYHGMFGTKYRECHGEHDMQRKPTAGPPTRQSILGRWLVHRRPPAETGRT